MCVGGWVGLLIRFAGNHGTPSGVQGNYTVVVVSDQASQVPLNFSDCWLSDQLSKNASGAPHFLCNPEAMRLV